ncbi:MAG: prolipoprotein diacylglyceryl transferase family protein [Pirellulales bacterium]
MWQTLYVIPRQIAGIDVFGFGWLLAIWAVVVAALVAWSWRRHGWGVETRSQLGAALVVGLAIVFLLPNLLDPYLDGLAIRGYGTMLLLAVLAGIGLSVYRARRVGLNPEIIFSLGTWLFVWGIIGARLFYIIEYWPRFQKPTLGETLFAMLNLTQGGLVVYGSMLAGGAALVVFIYKNRLPGLALSDLIAPGVVLGVGLGRLGCFLNGCCYGGPSDLPWAVRFPQETPAYVDQVEQGALFVHGLIFQGSGGESAVIMRVEPDSPAERQGLAPGQRVVAVGGVPVHSVEQAQTQLLRTYGEGQTVEIAVAGDTKAKRWTITGPPPSSRPIHPAQLYSLFDALLLCSLLLLYEPFKRRDGELTALVLTIYPLSRFVLEIIRVDESPVFGTGMSISQNISIAVFAGGVALWIYLFWRRPKEIAWEPRPAMAG